MKKLGSILLSLTFFLSACSLPKFEKNKEQPIEQQEEINQIEQQEERNEIEKSDVVDEEKMIEEKMDGRMRNHSLLQTDDLLQVGDFQIEKAIPNYTIQDPPSQYDKEMAKKLGLENNNLITNVHHTAKNPQLHPVFVNPKIKAMWGNYAENVVQRAWKYYGTPYQFGSNRTNDSTFDCSDYTRWIYLYSLGMDLPKDSRSQWEYVKKFSKHQYSDLSEAKRGDLLFFMTYKGWQKGDYAGINVKAQTINHCGIYLGNGMMLHTASAKTGGVRVDKIAGSHLEYRFVGGGSVLQ
jgi:peptidoglycan DL-endopeptidase CwlO